MSEVQRVAGIDCGTNTIRLLIADVPGGDGAPLQDVVREMRIVRLGQGVDKTGAFAPEALERTLEAVRDYAQLCEQHGVTSARFAATSAARDASNREEFIQGVVDAFGFEPQILTGDEEAHTSFMGAMSALPAGVPDDAPLIAVDLGGGSTELVLGTKAGGVISAYSMDVGSVRMRERYLHSDPPTEDEVEAARETIRHYLDVAEEHVEIGRAEYLVGLAGTVTSVTARALGLDKYLPTKIHGTKLPVQEVAQICGRFVAEPKEETAQLGFLHPGRVDVIGAGALVWQEVALRIAQRTREAGHEITEIVTSEHDILDGLALWAAEKPQSFRASGK